MTVALLVLADQDHMDWGGGWWVVMVIAMVLFWALIIAGAVWLFRSTTSGHAAGGHRFPSAIELLDRRFAEGEISTEEYAERRAVLEGRPPSET